MNSQMKWAGKRIRNDQLFLLYAMLHFLKNEKGESIGPDTGKDFVIKEVFHGISSKSEIMNILTKPEKDFTRKVAAFMNKDERIRVHYGNLVYGSMLMQGTFHTLRFLYPRESFCGKDWTRGKCLRICRK